ncbi:MAG TPA: hypothetical protein VE218_07815 [Acidobacteriaceae bacterium]|nr:hypothetical protein [Acidobacteriaceae bacterium]
MYPQCRHVRPNGEGCNAAALKKSHWCYFHHRLYDRYRAQQARLQLHSQRDASGRFTPAFDSPATGASTQTALVPTCDYGSIPVGERATQTGPENTSFTLPPIEDSASVQLALMDVLNALAANQIDSKRAGLLLYGLQVAAANAKHVYLYGSSVQSVTYTADGIALGPQEYGWDTEDIEEEIEREERENEE